MAEEINEIVAALKYLYAYGTGEQAHPVEISLQFLTLSGINVDQDEASYISQALSNFEVEENPQKIPVIYVLKKVGSAQQIEKFQKTSYMLMQRTEVAAEHIIKLSSSMLADFVSLGTHSDSVQNVVNTSAPKLYERGQIIHLQNPTHQYYLFYGRTDTYGSGGNQTLSVDFIPLNNEPVVEALDADLENINDDIKTLQRNLIDYELITRPLQVFRETLNF